jgi:hypothetical protein
MVNMLLKPHSGVFHNIADLSAGRGELEPFDVIGVTETELGDSLLDRARAIREMRETLDDGGIDAPIHVFGVLDPLLVAFYFMAGAELFDGLTWIRYGTKGGLAVYRDSAAVLGDRLELGTAIRAATAQVEFLDQLAALKRALIDWVGTRGDFSVFPHNGEALRVAHGRLFGDEHGGG